MVEKKKTEYNDSQKFTSTVAVIVYHNKLLLYRSAYGPSVFHLHSGQSLEKAWKSALTVWVMSLKVESPCCTWFKWEWFGPCLQECGTQITVVFLHVKLQFVCLHSTVTASWPIQHWCPCGHQPCFDTGGARGSVILCEKHMVRFDGVIAAGITYPSEKKKTFIYLNT